MDIEVVPYVAPRVRHQRLPTRVVAQRYNVSTKSIMRWAADSRLGFPRPLIINRRKYWSEAELDAFDARRRDTGAAA
jgi:hypothetical protein